MPNDEFWRKVSAEGATPLLAPYEAVKNDLRNAGYRGMSMLPALARGFIGNHDAHASKMETIFDELFNWWIEGKLSGSLDVWMLQILLAAWYGLDYYMEGMY